MTCFFPTSFIPISPHSDVCLSRERGSIIFEMSSIGFSILIRSTIFISLRKDRNSLHKVKIARARTTKSSSLRLGDPGWLDIQPAAGRKEDGKQQLPYAEMMSLDLHKGQVAKICHILPIVQHHVYCHHIGWASKAVSRLFLPRKKCLSQLEKICQIPFPCGIVLAQVCTAINWNRYLQFLALF